ncbi:MAG: biopolymer transporter ExbD [bacterium]|nr:biopolymer transporter ExbD [bacterium]
MKEPKIDTTPLADMMFLILLFFILSGWVVEILGLKINLPKGEVREIKPSKQVLITITKDKEFYFENSKVGYDELIYRVKVLAKSDPSRQILIKSDRSIEYGFVIELLDILKKNGVERIGLLTEKK